MAEKALITGATSGIGHELACIMAAEGHDLVIVSRNKKKLDAVKTELESKYEVKVRTQQADLSKPGSAKTLYDAIKKEKVEILVNNAGAGYVADFFDGDLDRHQSIAHLNMISLMELSYLLGGDFRKKGSGKILNVASIVAFFPGPPQPVYYATKAFVRCLSRALSFKLRDTGVTVTALHPGVTKTHFFDEANAPKQTKGADPRKVAQLGYDAMMAGKVEVTYGLWEKFLTNVFVRIVPYRLQTIIINQATDV